MYNNIQSYFFGLDSFLLREGGYEMNNEIEKYNESQSAKDQKICKLLIDEINHYLQKQRAKSGMEVLFGL